jgi:hypothetical protein
MCITLNVKNMFNPKGGCMKKLLVLALVLSMATMASAGLQISINGQQEAEEATITVVPSGSVTLDIWTDSAISDVLGGTGFYALAAPTSGGTLSGGILANATYWGCSIIQDAAGAGIALPAGDNGPYGAIAIAPGYDVIPLGTTIFDGIAFHCEGPGDVVVSLYMINGDTGELFGPAIDTVTIHQIPEPMTMALLGLGGLFLRRRK